MPVIYKITSPSNKVYIGQSWNWKNRQDNYRLLNCKRQLYIYKSLLKYGYDNHIFKILEDLSDITDQKELDRLEVYHWQNHKDQGYIMLNIKEPGIGGRHSTETKEKLRIASTGRTWSEEGKQKWFATKQKNNYKHPQEVLNKISLKLKGKTKSVDHIEKIRNSLKGHTQSKEAILKMISTKKINNKIVTEETRQKISKALKGKKHNTKFFVRTGRFKKVIDTQTNQIFNTIKEAAQENNITVYNLRNRLVGIVNNNTSLRLLSDV
jgi:group I intron endonuclease